MTKHEVLDALGIDIGKGNPWLGLICGLALGGAVGATIALLWAPKTGQEMRRNLGDRGREFTSRVKSRFEEEEAETH